MRIPLLGRGKLEGAPRLKREKTYASAGGYSYSYFFLGHRPYRGGVEYVFDVSADRARYAAVAVRLADAAPKAWAATHSRELEATERYAVAKLSLQRALDECVRPGEIPRAVAVTAEMAGEILDSLGID